MIGPDDVEIRVLGCLVEKQRTTPDQYPLTLNSLRLACNQSTNRDPVVDYDEATVRRALGELGRRRWIRGASGHTSRSPKYRHLLDTELSLADDQISVLAVLMLRGEQTPGQLKQRTERMFAFHDLDALQTTLDALASRELVERLPRRPGQKEDRYRQILGGNHLEDRDGPESETRAEPQTESQGGGGSPAPASRIAPTPEMAVVGEPLDVPLDTPESERIEALESQIADLTGQVGDLRTLVEDLREQLGA